MARPERFELPTLCFEGSQGKKLNACSGVAYEHSDAFYSAPWYRMRLNDQDAGCDRESELKSQDVYEANDGSPKFKPGPIELRGSRSVLFHRDSTGFTLSVRPIRRSNSVYGR